MYPTVTVLMCVYNDERFLSKSIESIINQTLSNFEFLIIDDASTDNTSSILNFFVGQDQRIRVISMPQNMGLGHCLNVGVREAKGEWVARMDSDDISVPHRLTTQLEYIEKNPDVDLVGSYALDIDEKGRTKKLRKVPIKQSDIVKLVWTNPFIHASVFFNRCKILNVGSYSKKARKRQDYELWFRCVKSNLGLANMDEPLLYYRYSAQTLKRNNPKVMFAQAKIGLKGCWLIRAPLTSYIGVTVPFIKSLFPLRMQKIINQLLLKFDPRAK